MGMTLLYVVVAESIPEVPSPNDSDESPVLERLTTSTPIFTFKTDSIERAPFILVDLADIGQ